MSNGTLFNISFTCILSSRLMLHIYALFCMVLDSLRVAVDVFEIVVGGC